MSTHSVVQIERGVAKILISLIRVFTWIVPFSLGSIVSALSPIAGRPPCAESEANRINKELDMLQEQVESVPDYETAGKRTLEMARWAYEIDGKRTTTLESKAGSLAAQAGTTLAIVFGLGALLFNSQIRLGIVAPVLATLYLSTLFLLAMTAWCVDRGMRVEAGWREQSKEDLFNLKALTMDGRDMYLAINVWKQYEINSVLNERKADWLMAGQRFFSLGMGALLAAGVTVVWGLSHGGHLNGE